MKELNWNKQPSTSAFFRKISIHIQSFKKNHQMSYLQRLLQRILLQKLPMPNRRIENRWQICILFIGASYYIHFNETSVVYSYSLIFASSTMAVLNTLYTFKKEILTSKNLNNELFPQTLQKVRFLCFHERDCAGL